MLQGRQIRPNLQEPGEERFSNDREPGGRVVDQMAEKCSFVGRVHRHMNGTRAVGAKPREAIFERVVQHDGDTFAGLESERDKAVRDAVRQAIGLGERDG